MNLKNEHSHGERNGAATSPPGKRQAEDQESPLGSGEQAHAKVRPLREARTQRKVLPACPCRCAT